MKKIAVVYLFIVLFLGIGWVTNLVKFAKCNFEPSYKAEVLRCVGVFVPPVGGIMGYITIKD